MIQPKTILDIFYSGVEADRPRAMSYRENGVWKHFSAQDVYQRTVNLARALRSWGVKKGDRTAILSENRPGWAIADFATLMIGAVDVPIYPTLTNDQTEYILRDSGAIVAFVSSPEQLRKVVAVQERTAVKYIVAIEDIHDRAAINMRDVMLSSPYARDEELDALATATVAADLATIIYTSGTTGTPKGVKLTHGNIASNVAGSRSVFDWSRGEGYVSFLPLSHITARHVDYVMWAYGIGISYCPSFDDLPMVLKEVKPHNFVSVPRVYEKIRQEAERRAQFGMKRRIFDWALRVGKEHRAEVQLGKMPNSLSWRIARRLVFNKIAAALGGNAEVCISGGAPLGVEVGEWFADVGIRIFEGYGLTETSPVIAINRKNKYRLGTVGPPLDNIECRIADDGELLVRGPSVTSGYWNLPEETQSAFEAGWFKTGDIAALTDGFLKITDRKKDLIKTSGGKFIAPQPIENALKSNVLVAHAAVIGDRRKFPSVLIAPHFPLLEDWARANEVSYGSHAELIADVKVRSLFEGIVAELNKDLAQFERLKRVVLVPDELSIDSG